MTPAASKPMLLGSAGFIGERPERNVTSVQLRPIAWT
jgi:hypothetical protein